MQKVNFRHVAAGVGALALSGAAMAQSTVADSISTAQTEVAGYIAVGGAAMIAIAVLGVGWRVGVKLVKRLSGAV